ncbi:MAG: zinc ribbon domain-containing protein [Nostocaceae cyanobacterium]|nr:zinc ribbon domain-containing protein [Nostocaceae cyanobacterium]
MLLGFKTQLKLNNHQRTQLARHCGVFKCECCGLQLDRDLNAALNLNKAVS